MLQIEHWKNLHRQRFVELSYREQPDGALRIRDSRFDALVECDLAPSVAEVYRAVDSRPRKARVAGDALAVLEERRLIWRDGDVLFGLAVPPPSRRRTTPPRGRPCGARSTSSSSSSRIAAAEVEMVRLRLMGAAVIGGLAIAGWAAPAYAQEKLDRNAQFCEDFDQNVIIGGKLDDASKYLTEDFKEHNARLTANGLPEFLDRLKAMRAARGAGGNRGGGAGRGPAAERTIFSHDDVVVFMRPTPERDDPQNPGRRIPAGTHFDVYRLRNGKIAEHWD